MLTVEITFKDGKEETCPYLFKNTGDYYDWALQQPLEWLEKVESFDVYPVDEGEK